LAGLPTEYFAKAHRLEARIASKVPKDVLEQALSRDAAEKLLKRLGSMA
jgi:hypothetical protein